MLPLPCNVEPFMKPIWLVVFRIMIAMPTLSRENFLCTLNSQVKSWTRKSQGRSKVKGTLKYDPQIWPLRIENDYEKTNTCTCKTAFTPESVPRIPGHSDVFWFVERCWQKYLPPKNSLNTLSIYTEHCIMTGWYDIYSAHVMPPRRHSMDSGWQEQLVALHLDNMVASYDQKGVVKGYYQPFSAYLGLWPAVWTRDFVRNFFVSATSRNEWNHVGNNVAIAMQCGTLHETNLAGCV